MFKWETFSKPDQVDPCATNNAFAIEIGGVKIVITWSDALWEKHDIKPYLGYRIMHKGEGLQVWYDL